MPLTTRETFTPSERRRNRRSCRFSTAILNIPHEMGNLAVRNAHTPVYRRSGLKREHKAPQVLEQELSTASDPPQPKLGGLWESAQILCRTRYYTGTVQTFPATRSRKGKHALRSHAKSRSQSAWVIVPQNAWGRNNPVQREHASQCCSHTHRQCDKRSLQPARTKTSRLARTQVVA